MKHWRFSLFFIGVFLWPLSLWAEAEGEIVQLEIEGPIGPATTDYVKRAFDRAINHSARLILLRLDTPGGLDLAMRDIIKQIIASPIPVVAYVAPSGARAASAGTYILYAAHIAAMAPATSVGAATPVQLAGPGPSPPKSPGGNSKKQDKEKTKPHGGAMERKMINDAVAYIKGLAKMRGRNAQWAEKAVREAATLTAEEALEKHVIDLIATDIGDLLHKLDGRKVTVLGQEVVLHTQGAALQIIEPDWRSRLLAVLTNPNIAYILMLLGIYGLIFEFSNPGAVVPGVLGGICLLLALFAFQVLPINYAGLALILLGLSLMVAEAFVPSFGILGIGGVVAFTLGSIMLTDTAVPGFGIHLELILAFAATSALLFIMGLGMVIKARHNPVVTGKEELLHQTAEALEDFESEGWVRLRSERWRAITNQPVRKGDLLKVTRIEGLTLYVTPIREEGQ